VSRAVLLAAAVAGALAPPAVRAHEVTHQVDRSRAVAVRVTYADGAPLAYAECEVFSPGDRRIPHQKGRTDRDGWVAFVPSAPGGWRVRVVDGTGHGLDVVVDATAALAPASATAGAPQSTAAFLLRRIAAMAAIVSLFAALVVVHRRRGAAA
jgi:nickel transport protein